MAPGIISDLPMHSESSANGNGNKTSYPKPLKLSGALDAFAFEDATPVIGREYPTLNIVDDLLNASNADELLQDLAINSRYLSSIRMRSSYSHFLQSPNVASSFSAPRTT